MFGIPITTLISMGITYGPGVIKFIQAADPLLHQLVSAAIPLAKQIVDSGGTHEDAASEAINTLAENASYYDKAKGLS